jgi:hypothetical protein
VALKLAFCFRCNRTVHVSDDSPLACPVCSSPLVEATLGPTMPVVDPLPAVGPELYLG